MVIKEMKSILTAETPLEYNIKKVSKGEENAKILYTHNIPGNTPEEVKACILEREENPYKNPKFTNFGYHLTINPGPGEDLEDDEVKRLAEEIMTELGFEDQPWVLFQHTDIDRKHYHIVSTRVRKNAKMVNSSFTGYKILMKMRELGNKYGFVVGKSVKSEEPDRKQPRRLNLRKGDLRKQAERIIEDTFRYSYKSVEEFREILKTRNVELIEKDGVLSAYALDNRGQRGSRAFSIRPRGNALTLDRILEGTSMRVSEPRIAELKRLILHTLNVSDGWKQFNDNLRKIGIDAEYKYNKDFTIEDAVFYEHAQSFSADLSTLGIKEQLNEAAWLYGWTHTRQTNKPHIK